MIKKLLFIHLNKRVYNIYILYNITDGLLIYANFQILVVVKKGMLHSLILIL